MHRAATELRSAYHQALILLLLPIVFLVTLIEDMPGHWRKNLVAGVFYTLAMSTMMALGLFAVYVIKVST